MQFHQHEVEWTDEKVARFWDNYSKISHLQYFAQQAGKKVIKISKKYVKVNSDILDYGSGKGHLIQYLLESGMKNVSGCDFSYDSVSHVNETFKNNKNFGGCFAIESLPSVLQSEKYNCVFFMETIEHLLDSYYEPTLQEINRIVRKDGFVVVTTRNEENLNDLKVLCPDCGAVFHRVQHVRSFSRESITTVMDKFGFSKVFCDSVELSRRQIIQSLLYRFRKLSGEEYKNSNLIYIGRKR